MRVSVNGVEQGSGGLPAGGADGDTLGYGAGGAEWRSASEERQLVQGAAESTFSLADGSGWTLQAGVPGFGGPGSVVIAGGGINLSVPDGSDISATDFATMPAASRPLADLVSTRRWTLRARCNGYVGGDMATRLELGCFREGDFADSNVLVRILWDDAQGRSVEFVWNNGMVQGSDADVFPVNGTGWVRLSQWDGTLSAWWGVGVLSAPPADDAWKLLGRLDIMGAAEGIPAFDTLFAALGQDGGPSVSAAAVWANVTIVDDGDGDGV